jgi:hypothetical protein
MSRYLHNLVAKNLQLVEVIRPRTASRFEPSGVAADGFAPSGFAESDARPRESLPEEEQSQTPTRPRADNSELLPSQLPPPADAVLSVPHPFMREHRVREAHFREEEKAAERSAVLPVRVTPSRVTAVSKSGESRPQGQRSPVVQVTPGAVQTAAAEGPAPNPPVSTTRIVAEVRAVATPRFIEAAPAERGVLRTETRESAGQNPRLGLHVVQPTIATVPSPIEAQRESAGPSSAHAAGPPTIKVTIGRIDVRAIMPAAPAPRPAPSRQSPRLSLGDYLKQSNGGRG